MLAQIVAVAIGSVFGGWARWLLSMWLNPRIPNWPLGTLASNLIGGYIVGFAVAFFAARTDLAPAWRLLVITGFLGGLTTFSSFSAEVVTLLLRGDYVSGGSLALMHVVGTFVLTALGIATFRMLAG